MIMDTTGLDTRVRIEIIETVETKVLWNDKDFDGVGGIASPNKTFRKFDPGLDPTVVLRLQQFYSFPSPLIDS